MIILAAYLSLAARTGQIVLGAVVVTAGVAVLTWFLKRHRRDVWSQLARKRGLNFTDDRDLPRLTGQTRGRAVEVVVNDGTSDRDVGGVEVVLLKVQLQHAPPEMTAEGEPGLIGDLVVMAEDHIEFESEDFKGNVLVKGDEPSARAYWSPERQQIILRLIETAPCDQIAIREGVLVGEIREIVSDRQRLEQLLDLLLDAAAQLDDSPVAQDA